MLLKRSLCQIGVHLIYFFSGWVIAQPPTPANKPSLPGVSQHIQATPDQYDPTIKVAPALVSPKPQKNGVRALIWEVKPKDGGNIAYIFGTIHVGKAIFYPLPDAVEDAFRRSAKLVVEANITDQKDSAEMARLIDFPKGESIENKISPALLLRLKEQLARHKIPFASVATMRPVMLGGMLPIVEFVQLGYEMDQGLDFKLTKLAQEQKKPILELESPLEQIRLLTNMSPQLQEAFLENAIRTLEQGRTSEQVTGIVNAWQLGDAQLMVEITDEVSRGGNMVEQINDILLTQRHPAMLAKIEGFLSSSQTHFVAVGSLHLVGKRGLIEMLAARGYIVRQL